jgi:hypothetical protein
VGGVDETENDETSVDRKRNREARKVHKILVGKIIY